MGSEMCKRDRLGTGVGTEIAQNKNFAGIILESPFTSMVDAGADKYPIFPIRLLLKDKYESDKKIKNITSPILIMHGEADNIVPFWMGKKMYELANEPKYYYFSKYAPFDSVIFSTEQFLGYPIGEMHTRHDLIVSYMEYLSDNSDKAKIFYYGKTYEKRKLLILAISSTEKIVDIEKIRDSHISYLDPEHPNYNSNKKPDDFPVIINLAYNVHGNEPSSSEAALLTAYTLVSSQSDEINKYLNESIILIDPTINPDGRDRHTH